MFDNLDEMSLTEILLLSIHRFTVLFLVCSPYVYSSLDSVYHDRNFPE